MKLLCILILLNYISSLYFDLMFDTETCFEDSFSKYSIILIEYKTLIVNDKNDVNNDGYYDFKLKDPMTKRVIDSLKGTYSYEGKVYFTVPDTEKYLICVQGITPSNSRESRKRNRKRSIKFNINISTTEVKYNSTTLDHDELADEDFFKIVNNKIKALSDVTNNIEEFQQKDINDEEEFTNFQTNNNSTLLYIILFQIILILLVMIYSCLSLKTQIRRIVN